ncbi:ABC transporter permease [Dermabacteraceae bacterium P13264]
MFLGWREIRNAPGRYLGLLSLIALISYLVFFLTGLAYGLAQANRSALDALGVRGMVISEYANSSLSASRIQVRETNLRTPAGDAPLQPLRITQAVASTGGEDSGQDPVTVALLATVPGSVLRPAPLTGRTPESADEVLAADSLRTRYGVKLGDTLRLKQSDTDLRVVGFAPARSYSVTPVLYTDLSAEETSGKAPLSAIAVLPTAAQGEVDALANQADYTYLPLKDVIWALPGYTAQVYTFSLMIGFLVLICAIVIGIFMYIITMQKRPVFGVLKAQGVASGYIARAVLTQTVLVAGAGIAVGALLTAVSALILPDAVPYVANWPSTAAVAAAIFLVACIGAQASVWQVAKIDPLEAMR